MRSVMQNNLKKWHLPTREAASCLKNRTKDIYEDSKMRREKRISAGGRTFRRVGIRCLWARLVPPLDQVLRKLGLPSLLEILAPSSRKCGRSLTSSLKALWVPSC